MYMYQCETLTHVVHDRSRSERAGRRWRWTLEADLRALASGDYRDVRTGKAKRTSQMFLGGEERRMKILLYETETRASSILSSIIRMLSAAYL